MIDAEYQNRVQLINQEEQELLSQVGLTEEEIGKIRENASQKRLDAESDRFQTRLQNINEEENILLQKLNDTEALLLQNQQLTDEERLNIQKDFEAQRTDVIVNASAQRQSLRDIETQNELLALDNRFQEILTSEADNYDALVAVVDEKEKLLLSNTQLTEEERTRIQQEAANQRAGIRAKETNDQLALIDTELNNIATSFDRKRELINQREQELLQQEGLTEAQRTQIRQQGADERAAIDAAELDARAQVQSAYIDLVGQLGSTLQAIAGKNKKVAIAGVVIEQAAAIAKIVQNTAIANAKSVAALPLTGGQPFVAINTISAGLSIVSSIAAGLKAIQQIRNADSGNISSGGSIPRASAGLRAAGVEQTGVPTILGTEGANPQTQVAATIQRASQNQRPVRAYVVSQDISSTQALDRRTNTAATFG